MLFKTPDSPPRSTLRSLLRERDLVIAQGVWDGATAAIAEAVGLDCVITPGLAIAAALGYPDTDLYSKSENIDAVRHIASRTSAAIVADADSGYGHVAQVFHTVQSMEAAGASALLLEDQSSPKLACSWIAPGGQTVCDIELATAKIRAAVDARRDPETMIIARTDAYEPDEILRRGEAYAAAGADMVTAVTSNPEWDTEGWQRLREATGVPNACLLVPNTRLEADATPELLAEMGVRLLTLGLHTFNAAMGTVRSTFERFQAGEALTSVYADAMTTADFTQAIGFHEVVELEQKYTAGLVRQHA